MKSKKLLVPLLIAIGIIVYNSCKKDSTKTDENIQNNTPTYNNEQNTSKSAAKAENIDNDISNVTEDAKRTNSSYKKFNSTLGATITKDTGQIIIDFGSNPTLCNDGRYRSGKIIITFNGYTFNYTQPGFTRTITFDNYTVDSNKVEGSRTVISQGIVESNKLKDTIISDFTITTADNKTILWKSNKTRIWEEGMSTPLNISDDVFEISGYATGRSAEGVNFTVTINTPITIKISCALLNHTVPIVEGVMTISPEGQYPVTINFGDGTCDNFATATIMGYSIPITLK